MGAEANEKSDAILSIEEIERDIDRAFAASALKEEGYAQAVWTLLSVTEDTYLNVLHTPSHEEELHIFVDLRLNSLTYAMRVCYAECETKAGQVRNKYIDVHYKLAWNWLDVADHGYYSFCSIFPLWHRGKVEIAVDRRKLTAQYATPRDRAYETYNRLIRKDARPEKAPLLKSADIAALVLPQTSHGEDWFKVNFSRRLVARLVFAMRPVMEPRHSLPPQWAFEGFTLAQYREIFITLQAMLAGWTVARNDLAAKGLKGVGYRSVVWVVSGEGLFNRLRRYTGIEIETIRKVLGLLTFGSSGICDPDIAVQPLVDLRNGFFALSPFVWLNTSAERNLCVLLNQIPSQRKIYSRLKNEKESLLKTEMKEFLRPLGLDVRSGDVDGTDLDIAIIDRDSKHCLCLELKWFIEPAEVREGKQKTEELKEGIAQAKKVRALFERRDRRLVRDVLDIDTDYSFMTAVASYNWIGHSDAQDPDVPIVKVWHLLNKIKDSGSLRSAMQWLSNRDYIPREGKDFSVLPVEIKCGDWTCAWYGIKPLVIDDHPQA